jgi:hypothetical protein
MLKTSHTVQTSLTNFFCQLNSTQFVTKQGGRGQGSLSPAGLNFSIYRRQNGSLSHEVYRMLIGTDHYFKATLHYHLAQKFGVLSTFTHGKCHLRHSQPKCQTDTLLKNFQK